MVGAVKAGSGEAVAELDAAHSGNRENGMGYQRLDRVEKRLAETGGNALYMAFDNPSERISFLCGSVQQVRPFVLVRLTSDLHKIGMEGKSALSLCDDTGGH